MTLTSSAALVVASFVLTYSVLSRYFFHFSTDWQDEFSVFLIVGAVFLSSAAVQARREHVAIEAVSALLSARVNRVRLFLVDIASLIFCAYFAWKSWLLLHEAIVEGYRTGSTWQPPLRIPYSLMTVGMALLSIQIALQAATAGVADERAFARIAVRRIDLAGDVCRHADRVCAWRGVRRPATLIEYYAEQNRAIFPYSYRLNITS